MTDVTDTTRTTGPQPGSTAGQPPPVDLAELDATHGSFYDDPFDLFRWLRDNDPVHWNEKSGLWLIALHEDVSAISRDADLYCAKHGVRPKVAAPMSIISMDDPEHTRQRRLINKGFTPRQVRRLAPHIRELTTELIDEVQARGEIEFVEDFAMHVPLIVIAELMGLDPAGKDQLYRWSDLMMAGDGHTDPESPQLQGAAQAFGEYVEYLLPIIEARRAEPRDDMISILTGAFDEGGLDGGEFAAVEGEGLTADELLMFLCILVVAGNETTRNAISGGLLAFSRYPDQRDRVLEDPSLLDTAVDEIVRWVTPVMSFSRTVTADHELRGKKLKEGDKVLMLYGSANRDERAIPDPDVFKVDRDPNPHLGFGIGPHFCLGANLARLEVKIVFEELFARLRDIRVADPDAPLTRAENALVLGIESLPAVFTPVTSS